jgi:hypothetical protein
MTKLEYAVKKYVVGIDPDLVKSGTAELRVGDPISKIILRNLTLWSLMDGLAKEQKKGMLKCVYIEAGWLNKRGITFGGLCRARDSGMNHAVGKTIEMFCKDHEINYRLVRPASAKWTHEQFVRYTGCQEYSKTNQEQRDAARLIVGL